MVELSANQSAKEVVHKALKHYPSAIPWFIGIYDDWTIGYLKDHPDYKRILFRSENFSERNFFDICRYISQQIEKEVNLEFVSRYANFNNEPGRLVVKQLIEAVTDLIMDKPANFDVSHDSNQPNIQRDTIGKKEPQRNHSGFLEILSGVVLSPLVLACDPEYMRQKEIEIQSQIEFVELCCLLEDEVFMSSLDDNEIHLIATEENSEIDRITWTVEYQSRRYIAETDFAISKLYIFQENNTQ